MGILFVLFVCFIIIFVYFFGFETGMMVFNCYCLKYLVNSGYKGVKCVEKLLDCLDCLIGLILIGNNFVNIFVFVIVIIIGMCLYGDLGVVIVMGVLILVILVFVEVMFKILVVFYLE